MSDKGPSWWKTRTISSPIPSAPGANANVYLIFESFDKNARQHEILRVSATDGNLFWEGMFSHDEIFSDGHLSRSPTEYSARMRTAIDDVVNTKVNVLSHVAMPQEITVVVDLDQGPGAPQVKLTLKEYIDRNTFLERLMTYIKHVEVKRRLENERLDRRKIRRAQLQSLVDEDVRKKRDDDLQIGNGLKILMAEKKKYWMQRGEFTQHKSV